MMMALLFICSALGLSAEEHEEHLSLLQKHAKQAAGSLAHTGEEEHAKQAAGSLAHTGEEDQGPDGWMNKCTCTMTADNDIDEVWVNGVDITSTLTNKEDLGNWPTNKVAKFKCDEGTYIAVKASDAEAGCKNGGFAMKCTASHKNSAWHNYEAGTDWKAWGTKCSGSIKSGALMAGNDWWSATYTPEQAVTLCNAWSHVCVGFSYKGSTTDLKVKTQIWFKKGNARQHFDHSQTAWSTYEKDDRCSHGGDWKAKQFYATAPPTGWNSWIFDDRAWKQASTGVHYPKDAVGTKKSICSVDGPAWILRSPNMGLKR